MLILLMWIFYIKKYTKIYNNILIYINMKAKEIMEKYKITRNTLCNWVKKGWIKVEVLPSGRYIYIDIKINNTNENL
jgi:hypothetical protein